MGEITGIFFVNMFLFHRRSGRMFFFGTSLIFKTKVWYLAALACISSILQPLWYTVRSNVSNLFKVTYHCYTPMEYYVSNQTVPIYNPWQKYFYMQPRQSDLCTFSYVLNADKFQINLHGKHFIDCKTDQTEYLNSKVFHNCCNPLYR